MIAFHIQVKNTRTALRISQKELAARAKMKQSSLARVEAGDHSPSVTTMMRLAQALGYNLDIRLVPK